MFTLSKKCLANLGLNHPQSLEFSPQELRLLEDLFCTTQLTVEELVYTTEIDAIHASFMRSTGKAVAIGAFFLTLRSLERAGRLTGKSRCLKCDLLKAKVVAYLCSTCYRKIHGIPDPPVSSCRAVLSICHVQVPRREDGDPSQCLENIIRSIEECPPHSE